MQKYRGSNKHKQQNPGTEMFICQDKKQTSNS